MSDAVKTAQLRIVLSPLERQRLDDAASKDSKGTSTWARDILLDAAEAGEKKPKKKTKN